MVGVIANAIYPTPPELMDPATPEAVAQRVVMKGARNFFAPVMLGHYGVLLLKP